MRVKVITLVLGSVLIGASASIAFAREGNPSDVESMIEALEAQSHKQLSRSQRERVLRLAREIPSSDHDGRRMRTRFFVCIGIGTTVKVVGGGGAICGNGRVALSLFSLKGGLFNGGHLAIFTLIVRAPKIADISGIYLGVGAGASYYHLGANAGFFRKLDFGAWKETELGDDEPDLAPAQPKIYLTGIMLSRPRILIDLSGTLLRVSVLSKLATSRTGVSSE